MPKHKIIPITEEEVKRILDKALGDRRDYLILRLFAKTGMRLSELAGIEVRYIDFKAGIIWVHKAKRDERREVPVDMITLQLLRSFIADYKIAGPLWSVTYWQIRKLPGKYAGFAGLDKPVSCHSFRHFFITHLIRRGVDPYKVQRLAGHKSVNTTIDTYTHIATAEFMGDYNKIMGEW